MFKLSLPLVLLLALPVAAETYAPVSDKSAFLSLVKDRALRIGMFDLTLHLSPEGRIKGSAMGWDITGSWHWQDGYFCREMDWSGKTIDYDCQLVEARGSEKLRFTVNRGAGQSAAFDLR